MRKVEKVKLTCNVCGKQFEEYASHLRAEPFRGKCCSRKCKGLLSRNKFKKICLNCGKEFWTWPSNERQSIRNACSWGCRNEYYSGERSHLYTGGRFPYPAGFNGRLKRIVREIDNFSCAICGVTESVIGYKLHVHHIDLNKKNIDISNLVSMCRACHKREHVWITTEALK